MLLKMHLVKVHIAVFWGFFSPAVTHCNIRGSKNEGLLFGCIAFLSILLLHPVSNVHQHVFHKALHGTMVLYEWITHVSNVQQCVADPPCAGRGTSLWHLVHSPRAPRDARVSLERERETQRKQRVGSNVLLIKCPVSPSFSNIILQADLFFLWWRNASIHILPKHKVQQDI